MVIRGDATMSLIRYTPFPVGSFSTQLGRMLEDFDSTFGRFDGLGGGTFAPALDLKEDADGYTVALEVPGISQENLQISLENNVLTIRGIKEQKQQEEKGDFRRVERSYGSFTRSVTLPRNVDVTNVAANLTDGVLTVTLPKEEQAKPRAISIGTTTDSS
jgi:HSP20 family protein